MAFVHCPRDGTLLASTRIDGRDRPACPACGFADFKHVQMGANCVVERDGRVLLVKLSYGPRVGRWALPGGLVEVEETPEEAAVRETEEESGFVVALDGLLATFHRPPAPIIIVTFRAHITGGELRLAPEETSDAAFFSRPELPPLDELAWPSTIHGLDAWKAFERSRP